MPVKKKNNRKNIVRSEKNEAIIPTKREASFRSSKPIPIRTTAVELKKNRVTTLGGAQKKKRPK